MPRLMSRVLFASLLVICCGCSDEPSNPPSADGGSSGPESSAATGGGTKFESPESAFAAFVDATKANDWGAAAKLMTPDSQSMLAQSMILGGSFVAGMDESKQKSFSELLKKHGVDLDEEPSPGAAEEGFSSLTKSIEDLPGFIGEIFAWLDENAEGGDSGFPALGDLSDVKIEGEQATATVEADGRSRPIAFQLVEGSWCLHLPPSGPETSGGDFDAGSSDDYSEEVDDGSPSLGTLWVGEKAYKLRHATAYKAKHFDDPATVVLLTPRALGERQIGHLKNVLKEEGSDDTFFVRGPNLKLTFDEDGNLVYLFAWADNLSINAGSGPDAELKVEGNRVVGKAVMQEPKDVLDSTYRFEVKFDVELTDPAQ